MEKGGNSKVEGKDGEVEGKGRSWMRVQASVRTVWTSYESQKFQL